MTDSSGASVQGVLGSIAAADSCQVLIHEHVAATSAGIIRSWPELYGGSTP